jgi:hypothetical protein
VAYADTARAHTSCAQIELVRKTNNVTFIYAVVCEVQRSITMFHRQLVDAIDAHSANMSVPVTRLSCVRARAHTTLALQYVIALVNNYDKAYDHTIDLQGVLATGAQCAELRVCVRFTARVNKLAPKDETDDNASHDDDDDDAVRDDEDDDDDGEGRRRREHNAEAKVGGGCVCARARTRSVNRAE